MSIENELIPYHAVRTLGTGPALVLAPHPDDEVFGCAGAIMCHVAAGDPVTVIILTDGGGAWTNGPERESYVTRRRQESLTAAAVLGYGEPVFWDYRDRELSHDETLVQRLLVAATDTRWLYAPSPYEIHPDHHALGLAALETARRLGATVTLAFYEIGAPLPPNRLLDISDLLDRKRRAIACFTGQLLAQAYDCHVEALNRYRAYTLPREVEAAEAYWIAGGAEVDREFRTTVQTRSARLYPENEDIRQQLEHAQTRLRELQSQLENQQREWQTRFDWMTSSRSWRLTAPLRNCARRLRTLRDWYPGFR
jgi:LmbE family N-acetylglucosaminyl deacetylase